MNTVEYVFSAHPPLQHQLPARGTFVHVVSADKLCTAVEILRSSPTSLLAGVKLLAAMNYQKMALPALQFLISGNSLLQYEVMKPDF